MGAAVRVRGSSGLVLAALVLGCGAGDGAVFEGQGLTVSHVYATPPLAEGRPGALYLFVTSHREADALVELSGADLERGELHISWQADGRRAMERVDSLPIPAAGRLELRPGGAHGMLFGIAPRALEAGRVSVRLRFRSGTVVPVTARVVSPGELEELLGPAG